MTILLALAYLWLIAASIADAVSTWIGLQIPGIGEQNPLMRPFVGRLWLGLLVKAIGLSVIAAMMVTCWPTAPLSTLLVVATAAAWTTLVAVGNVRLVRLVRDAD